MLYHRGMKTETAIEYFKTKTALANALGIKKQAISEWREIVPFKRQLQLEQITNGELKAMSLDEALAK